MQNPKRVLLAGATGTIGEAIARRWAALGMGRQGEVQVRAVARNPESRQAESLQAAGIELVQADLNRPETLPAAVEDCSLVIHAAGGPSSQARLADGARNLYSAAVEMRAARFIQISSMDVYPLAMSEMDEEGRLALLGDPGADAHIIAENDLRDSAAGPGCPDLTILRLGAVYGPAAYRWTLRPLESARRRALSVPGTGDFPWFYLYVENMVDAVTAAATAPSAGVYNIFDGMTTYADFMAHYARMAGSSLRHIPAGLVRLKTALHGVIEKSFGAPPDLTSDALRASRRAMPGQPWRAEKAAHELGWHPRLSLEEGMEAIRRSNGFHHLNGRAQDPWRENVEWDEK